MHAEPLLKPQEFNETQLRILDSAITCVKQWGIEKTNINDIAKQAGVTRPTVYNYFPKKEDVIRTALLRSGYAFANRVIVQVNKHKKTADRLLAALVYALEQLPKEPYLALVTESNLSSYVNEDALNNEEGLAMCLAIFNEIFINESRDDNDLLEITELSTRIVLSMLMAPGPIKRSSAEMKSFLSKRLLPAVGL